MTTFSGLKIYRPGLGTILHDIAGEQIMRRKKFATLRISNGVGCVNNEYILSADWNEIDVFKLIPTSESQQPDVNCNEQRMHFPASGGSKTIRIWNTGPGLLNINNISLLTLAGGFAYDFQPISLAANETTFVTLQYSPVAKQDEEKNILLIHSDDPDENPLPIQMFGKTLDLDIGKAAVDFTMNEFEFNRNSESFSQQPFTLSDHYGKVVWLAVIGSW